VNGAQALIRTLVDSGVDVCFANPGTSEMHFVAALDTVPEMRAVLGLFEGVVTGAADGYGRMADRPAATLLHLGPGLGNGIANLHNARRAHTPIVNLVGDHATYHHQYDAPLDSDINALAGNVSGWVRTTKRAEDAGNDAADAVAAAMQPPGQVATLIVEADASWLEGAQPAAPRTPAPRATVTDETIAVVAKALRSGEPVTFLIGGAAVREPGLRAASRIAAATGAKVIGETFPARLERGAGVPPLDRLGYLAEFAEAQLAGARHLVLVDTKVPASFFAYPGKPSLLVPENCEVHFLSTGAEDSANALERLAEAVNAGSTEPVLQAASRPDRPTGPITGATIADALGARSRAVRSGWACRWPPAPRSRVPTVR
jgi:acetolactate synthase-1/2/3 large subunit